MEYFVVQLLKLCLTLRDPHGLELTRLLCPWGFCRQEHWSRLSFSSPVALPILGIQPVSPALAGRFFTTEPPGKPNQILVSELPRHVPAVHHHVTQDGRCLHLPQPQAAWRGAIMIMAAKEESLGKIIPTKHSTELLS